MKKFLAILFLGLLLFNDLSADEYLKASNFINEFNQDISKTLVDDLYSPEVDKKVNELIYKNFDVKGIGIYSINKYKTKYKKKKINDYNKYFKEYFVKSLKKRILKISSESKIISQLIINDKYTLVNSEFQNLKMTWRVYTKDPNNFLIRDIVIDNLSLAKTTKKEFETILEKNNFDLEILINMLKKEVN